MFGYFLFFIFIWLSDKRARECNVRFPHLYVCVCVCFSICQIRDNCILSSPYLATQVLSSQTLLPPLLDKR